MKIGFNSEVLIPFLKIAKEMHKFIRFSVTEEGIRCDFFTPDNVCLLNSCFKRVDPCEVKEGEKVDVKVQDLYDAVSKAKGTIVLEVDDKNLIIRDGMDVFKMQRFDLNENDYVEHLVQSPQPYQVKVDASELIDKMEKGMKCREMMGFSGMKDKLSMESKGSYKSFSSEIAFTPVSYDADRVCKINIGIFLQYLKGLDKLSKEVIFTMSDRAIGILVEGDGYYVKYFQGLVIDND